MMVAQPCKRSKNHGIIHFKRVNFICELYIFIFIVIYTYLKKPLHIILFPPNLLFLYSITSVVGTTFYSDAQAKT